MTLQKLISDRSAIEAKEKYQCPVENYSGFTESDITKAENLAFKEGALSLLPFIEEISVKFSEWVIENSVNDRDGLRGVVMDDVIIKAKTTQELFSLFMKEYLKQEK